ncbi:MAG: methyltransferase domain-containing protein [Parvularculaceae bacterium]|nr:methyltransferase domain-containing protein [Parvularculaceae bacterium]
MSRASPPRIFDRNLYARRRARAANKFAAHDFLHRRAMEDIVDRLETVTRDFPRALFIGVGGLRSLLSEACGVSEIIEADLSAARLTPGAAGVVMDEERLAFAPQSFDLVVSLLHLHTANDLIGALVQLRRALKPDGLLLASVFGEETLREMRAGLYAAEAAHSGGVSPRVAPFASVRDLGAALQRAGFALPVADLDRARVAYRTPQALIDDLRGMGETNCLANRGRGLRKSAAGAAMAALRGGDAVTFDIVTLTGWAPDESQPKPLKPGSATHSLAAAVRRSEEDR